MRSARGRSMPRSVRIRREDPAEDDSAGATIGDEDGDPAPYVTARVKILF